MSIVDIFLHISDFITRFFGEISPTLLPVPGVDTATYQKQLVERFGEFWYSNFSLARPS